MPGFDGVSIDQLLTAATDGGAMAGAVVVVGDRDGVLYEGGAGELPDGTSTMFRIASMTKAITSVATLQLVEEGLLDLDAEVASVLPAFAELQVLDGFDGDTPRLRPPATQATIRQLLTHTSGCSYFFTNADLVRWHGLTGAPHVLTGLKASLNAPLIADPGTRWEYGVSTDWAGQVVEAIRGQSLAAVCAERIFAPLGMTDATFEPDDAQRARLLGVKDRAADGSLQDSPIDLPQDPEFHSGGGGLYATASDYLRFLRALLRGGELDGARILGAELVEEMFSDQLGGIALPEVIKSSDPTLTNDVQSLPIKQGWGCGLSLFLEDIPGMRRAGSGSWAGLMNSFYWIDRTSGVTAAIFTQILPFFDEQVIQTALGVEAAVYAELGAAVS
jgi:CubicO group peptidase (beta-lactamase class C family)